MNQLDDILEDYAENLTAIQEETSFAAGIEVVKAANKEAKHELLAFLADYIEATPAQRNRLQLLISGGDV